MSWLKQSPGARIVVAGGICLLLLIPLGMVMKLINERQRQQEEVVYEINQTWGGEQSLSGPVLVVPVKKLIVAETGTYAEREMVYFLPETLDISGDVKASTRYRSIFETVVYDADLTIMGTFKAPQFDWLGFTVNSVEWDEAALSMGITWLKGIDKVVEVKWNGVSSGAEPGTIQGVGANSGVTMKVNCSPETKLYTFTLQIKLKGAEGLWFSPAGRVTTVNLSGDWSTPSFAGEFLPDSRQVTDKGFEASWEVLHLNRNLPQQWHKQNVSLSEGSFGLKLLLPVSQYQEAMRLAKYGILFILLTYVALFLTEFFSATPLHPVQYLLTGLPVVLFYLLLLSLSEHIRFDLAYGASALAIVFVVGGYIRAVMRSFKSSLLVAGNLVLLYGCFYVLLQLEDYALLAGSLGALVLLTVIMFLTRKIDWYTVFGGMEEKSRSWVRNRKSPPARTATPKADKEDEKSDDTDLGHYEAQDD